MSHNRLQIMGSERKRDQALRVADFKIDELLSVPINRLLAEVAEDHGDSASLAAAFDAAASPVLSRYDGTTIDPESATFSARPAVPSIGSVAAAPRASIVAPWSFLRAALAMSAQQLAAALRRRVLVGAFATLLLVAALAPALYSRLIERPADGLVTASKDHAELAPAPAPRQPASSAAPAMNPAPAPSAAPAGTVSPASLPDPAGAPASAAAASPPIPRAAERSEASPLPPPAAAAREAAPRPMAEPPAVPLPQGPVQSRAAAKSSLPEGSGYVVQLSATTSEAEAQSTFQTLKSRYALLKEREPIIRRKDQGARGIFYIVQVGPFASRADAVRLCELLKAAGGTCFTTRN